MSDVAGVVESAKALLEAKVADLDIAAEDISFHPAVVLWRGGRQVATVLVGGNRDEALVAAKAGVMAYAADRVALVMDMYVATPKWWAEGRAAPAPGELQKVWEAGGTDLVSECLLVMWAHRAGGLFMIELPYVLDRAARTLQWTDSDPEVKPQPGGLLARTLVAAFAQPDLLTEATSLGFTDLVPGATAAEVRLQTDIAGTRFLMELGHGVMMEPEDLDAMTVIRESFAGDQRVSYYARYGDSYEAHGPIFEEDG